MRKTSVLRDKVLKKGTAMIVHWGSTIISWVNIHVLESSPRESLWIQRAMQSLSTPSKMDHGMLAWLTRVLVKKEIKDSHNRWC